MRLRSIRAVGLAVLLLGMPSLNFAQRPNEPRYFAIRDARIVTVSGPLITRGTVVLAKGLIAAVGTDVTIPPEAWVIEGRGLTVYPGLIDALTDLGLTAPPAAEEVSTSEREVQPLSRQSVSRGPEDRPATTPWENAADRLQTENTRLETWRKAGFTSAVTVADRGIFPGQAAFINLAGRRANELVVKTPVALRINLPVAGLATFPNSLMGVFAYIKQVFLEAEHYRQAWSLYEAEPRGLERPTYDRALEPIRQAVENHWAVLIPATRAREIDRAVRLGEKLRVNTLIYGAHQGYQVADRLAEKKVTVLVSLKWPERAKDTDPEAEVPLRVLRLRDRAPSTPAVLHEAGVKFAFYSDGLCDPQDLLKNVRKAIDAGLAAEAALRALTLSAAEIFGVSRQLGSLEVGKIANLLLTDGDLFAEKTRVKRVFIDGRNYAVGDPETPLGDPP